MKKLILFSGMGADERLLQRIQIPGIVILTPDHLKPLPDEDLSLYAARVAEEQVIGPEDIIGGASFGGMLAAEIAAQRPVAGLILLGSCLCPDHLPGSYRWLERMSGFIPDAFFKIRSWPLMIRWRFAPLDPETERQLVAMAADSPIPQLRHFGRMIVHWPGRKKTSCPVLSIHGDQDHIIPPSCAEPGIILPKAGHAFTLTHADATIAAIREFLEKMDS